MEPQNPTETIENSEPISNHVNAVEQPIQKPPEEVKKKKHLGLFFVFIAIILLFVSFVILYKGRLTKKPEDEKLVVKDSFEIRKFESDSEFSDYISKKDSASGFYGVGDVGQRVEIGSDISEPKALMPGSSLEAMSLSPERISETNIQVAGIDEPDILKTDGINIYFSNRFFGVEPMRRFDVIEEEMMIYPTPSTGTKVINAYPPEEIKTIASIDESGEMLLFDKTLITLTENKFSGYDVSDPSKPERLWYKELEKNTYIQTVRKFDNKLYVITKTYIYTPSPCPLPLIKEGLSINCTDIYYPLLVDYSDTSYTILIVNPHDGTVEKSSTFLGASQTTVTYMSENYIYISFAYHKSFLTFFIDFMKTKASDIFPNDIVERLELINSYEISDDSKMNEFGQVLTAYIDTLTDDEEKRIENEMQNRLEDYMKDHSRDLEKSGIARFDVNDLKVTSSEAIPGTPLNQFSLDEYQGNLRIATTTSNSFTGTSGSFNDVYVLDENLKVIGSIKDLGLTERIYSARFVGERGYLVTFRQIDPFYILDMSDPKNPKMTGELKIPGFSSYLHPISENLILGIGQEGMNAKVSLFDVSDSTNPKEISKYELSEYWSEVSSNHHAFLQDEKHKIFFMPAGQNGYIFSYKDNSIGLERVVTGLIAKRALYLDDYLYVLGDAKMIVLDENNWEEVISYDYK